MGGSSTGESKKDITKILKDLARSVGLGMKEYVPFSILNQKKPLQYKTYPKMSSKVQLQLRKLRHL